MWFASRAAHIEKPREGLEEGIAGEERVGFVRDNVAHALCEVLGIPHGSIRAASFIEQSAERRGGARDHFGAFALHRRAACAHSACRAHTLRAVERLHGCHDLLRELHVGAQHQRTVAEPPAARGAVAWPATAPGSACCLCVALHAESRELCVLLKGTATRVHRLPRRAAGSPELARTGYGPGGVAVQRFQLLAAHDPDPQGASAPIRGLTAVAIAGDR
jgi:hypothetical protein